MNFYSNPRTYSKSVMLYIMDIWYCNKPKDKKQIITIMNSPSNKTHESYTNCVTWKLHNSSISTIVILLHEETL